MSERPEERDREDRIRDEVVVDAYGPEEEAMGWYYYLDDRIRCPFRGECRETRPISPLRLGERVEVLGMAPTEECEREMFVTVRWRGRELAVPLAQIEPVRADEGTVEAVGDWHYWLERGYRL